MSVLIIKAKMCNWSDGTRAPRAALAPPRLTYRDGTFYYAFYYHRFYPEAYILYMQAKFMELPMLFVLYIMVERLDL